MNLNDLFESLRTENPCWKGYKPVGTKEKNGRTVPNCVPKESVAEDAEDTVRFILHSERAYEAVMDRMGDLIDWDEYEYMLVPSRLWPKVQQIAADADGIGAENVDDNGPEDNPEHYGVAEGFSDSRLVNLPGGNRNRPLPSSRPWTDEEKKKRFDDWVKASQEKRKQQEKQQGVAEGEKSPMVKDAQRADRIRSLKNLIAIAQEQGRQLRVQELELELKKLQGVAEAAKWRDPKYKDRLYTQEPGDSDDYDNIGYGYDFPERPENDPGQKRRMGGVGSEFDRNDPLVKGQGIGRSGIKHSLNLAGKRKGLPSRDQITSLKGSIKDAHGKHRKPNLPEQGVAEGFADDFAAFAKERGGKLRHGPQPTKPAAAPAAPQPTAPVDREALSAELKQLQAQFDPQYQYSDDYSFWSKQDAIANRIAGIKKQLGEGEPGDLEHELNRQEYHHDKIGDRYDADEFDAMVGRLKKLAGAGPLKTVYDPATRRYKNVPTAVQPTKK